MSTVRVVNENSDKTICKHCGSEATVKFGSYEGSQRYYCKACKRKFIPNDSLFRMKTPYTQVATALDDYYSGKSINDIRNSMLTRTGNYPGSKTVYKWIVKFTDEAVKQYKDYHPQVGDTIVCDETVLRLDGKNIWCIDAIDRDTRYLLGTKLSYNRSAKDIQELLEQIRELTGKVPKRILTDGWKGYLDGIEQAYGADAKHIQTDPFDEAKSGENSELIERWHSTLKERTKTLRGLKSVASANRFLAGFCVFYNYLRPHEYLNGKTPAEVAKVPYTAKTWGDIIRVAHPQVEVLHTPAKVDVLSEHKPLIRPIVIRTYDVKARRERRVERRRIQKRAYQRTHKPAKNVVYVRGLMVSRHPFPKSKRVRITPRTPRLY